MKVRCRKCGRIENAILTTLAAAVYDWRLGFGNDPRWRRKVYVWEHNACDLDGRWIWEPGAPVPKGWDVVVEEKEAVEVGRGS